MFEKVMYIDGDNSFELPGLNMKIQRLVKSITEYAKAEDMDNMFELCYELCKITLPESYLLEVLGSDDIELVNLINLSTVAKTIMESYTEKIKAPSL